MDRMTDESWRNILAFLDPLSLIRCARVCRRFNSVITHSSSVQLVLHQHLHDLPSASFASTNRSKKTPHERLIDLIQLEKSFSSFMPAQRTLDIGPNEVICAAQDGRVITKLDPPIPCQNEVGRWTYLVEYTEDNAAWIRKEHTCDFEPNPNIMAVDLPRDLVVLGEMVDITTRMIIKVLSLSNPSNISNGRVDAIQLLPDQQATIFGMIRPPLKITFGPRELVAVTTGGKVHLYSLEDGLHHATTTLPSKHIIYRTICLYPDNLIVLLGIEMRTIQGDTSTYTEIVNFIYVYDLSDLPPTSSEPVHLDKPKYQLVFPRKLSDLPTSTYNALKSTTLMYESTIGPMVRGDPEGTFIVNGIIHLTIRLPLAVPHGHFMNQCQELTIYVDIRSLTRCLATVQDTQQETTIVTWERWSSFSYIHVNVFSGDHESGFASSCVDNKKMFRWNVIKGSGEMTVSCHELNQRVLRFSGDPTVALGGLRQKIDVGCSETLPSTDQPQKSPAFESITHSRSDITPRSLGAITHLGTYSPLEHDSPIMLFDGERVILQHAVEDRNVRVFDFR